MRGPQNTRGKNRGDTIDTQGPVAVFKMERLDNLGLARLKNLVLAQAKAISGDGVPSRIFCESHHT